MAQLITAHVTIQGLRPLLWHHFGIDTLAPERKERSGSAGNDPDEWRRTVLVTPEGQLYLAPSYAFGALRDGARYTKKGRGSLQPLIAATVQVLDDQILTDRVLPEPLTTDPSAPVFLDVRSVRNPVTRARNLRYRIAAASGWRASFTLRWDRTIISRGELEAVLHDAGQLVGLGDGRTIGFGRFQLDTITIDEG